MKYMIHAVPKRMWYVNDYLIPSMVAQGIDRDAITVFCDDKGLGNLRAWVFSCKRVDDNMWHLQDDVIISSNFAEVTNRKYNKIICGFCSHVDDRMRIGEVPVQKMWYSFQCIYIPKRYIDGFIEWFQTDAGNHPKCAKKIAENKGDDAVFMRYVWEKHKNDTVIHLMPNIVEHIYDLIGGSVVNKARNTPLKAIYWDEPELIQNLERSLRHGMTNK